MSNAKVTFKNSGKQCNHVAIWNVCLDGAIIAQMYRKYEICDKKHIPYWCTIMTLAAHMANEGKVPGFLCHRADKFLDLKEKIRSTVSKVRLPKKLVTYIRVQNTGIPTLQEELEALRKHYRGAAKGRDVPASPDYRKGYSTALGHVLKRMRTLQP